MDKVDDAAATLDVGDSADVSTRDVVNGVSSHAMELDEATHALKLLNEKQAAELNAKELLLTRKSERIDELLTQLRARDAQLDAANIELLACTARSEQLQRDATELHEQLRKDEDDFAMVAAALAAQEQAVVARNADVAAAREAERCVRKELDRSLVIIRRLERSVEELQPETADACLSPRSFHENQLIALRDDAITARTREVWLLSGQNAQLRVQLDDLETAMAQLETHALMKENDVARKQRRIEKLTLEVEAFQASRSQAEGRERAMEIATTQNHKLLVALEAQERVNAELTERLMRFERECEQLRAARATSLERAAESDVEMLYRTREAEERSAVVSTLQDKLQRERRALQHEVTTSRLQHQVETEKMQTELVMRRTRQYELTLKLQDTDARLHVADDALDATREQLVATTCRMDELERVLQDALQWKHTLEAQLATQATDAAAAHEHAAQQLCVAQSEVATLSAQRAELMNTLAQQQSQLQRSERDVRDTNTLVEARDALVREQRERIARLVKEVNREAQMRAELELERQLLRDQLEALRRQAESSLCDVDAQKRRLDDKHQRLRDKCMQLECELRKEQAGKAKLLSRFTEAFIAAAVASHGSVLRGSNGSSSSNTWATSGSLDLRECALSDQDLLPLLRMLEHAAPEALVRIDLRSNRFTQDGMRTVAAFAKKLASSLVGGSNNSSCGGGDYSTSQHTQQQHACRVRDIDLRQNCIALDGVRVVASSLESLLVAPGGPHRTTTNQSASSTAAAIKSVIVKGGGRIECFADAKPELATRSTTPWLVIDISANFDVDVVAAEARKLHRRRGRESDSIVGHSSNSNSSPVANSASVQRDQQIAETYGVDLVSALLGSDGSSSGVASSTHLRRRSSLEKLKPASLLSLVPPGATTIATSSPRESLAASRSSITGSSNAQSRVLLTHPIALDSVKNNSSSSNNNNNSSNNSARLSGSSSLPKLSG